MYIVYTLYRHICKKKLQIEERTRKEKKTYSHPERK